MRSLGGGGSSSARFDLRSAGARGRARVDVGPLRVAFGADPGSRWGPLGAVLGVDFASICGGFGVDLGLGAICACRWGRFRVCAPSARRRFRAWGAICWTTSWASHPRVRLLASHPSPLTPPPPSARRCRCPLGTRLTPWRPPVQHQWCEGATAAAASATPDAAASAAPEALASLCEGSEVVGLKRRGFRRGRLLFLTHLVPTTSRS